ncbi:polymer-forming cytoskeletal protein [Haemophilus parahaemolyticus]|uniref:polymer-forming cytoskeletal protein n=1 Tax=Haemophilus parahaemolyticus TaxID=735 RepID=UPI000DAC9902|nr:polymer-forming cytoskeletal protein [Haemophilus parahaemolyticus]RDE83101.1 polymer-forming cytoskeletal protein [Haemophilus parahaemolyticus]
MTQKKYELLKNDTITAPNGKTLYRIKALIDFGVVLAGSLGGYIEKEDNLTHTGNAWVYGDARVYGNARVSGDARVYGDAEVYGDARVYGDAQVSGDTRVSGNDDLVWFSNVGTEQGTLTVYKSKDDSLLATRGCFSRTVDEFLAKSAKVHNERVKREYQLLIEVAKSRLLGESYVPNL